MADARTLEEEAAAAKGKLEKAAELYREALRGDPADVATRLMLAEVLRRAGGTAEAIESYRAVADRFARDGLLIKAIAISKTILELEPAHGETQAALAGLYARRAAAEGTRPPARTVVMTAVRAPVPAQPAEERAVAIPLAPAAATPLACIQLAARDAIAAGVEEEIVLSLYADGDEGVQLEVTAASADHLPRFPIFSDLSRDAFLALTGAMALRRADEGEVVIREGDTGTSFFVVATGALAVSRRDDRGDAVALAHLGEGDFFGEMALLSGAARAATVVAERPCELLEFRAEALLAVARAHPHLAGSLRRFYRQRLLANAMAVSPVFRPFPKGDRKLLMGKFRARDVAEGETVIREGDPSDGLYVVLDGAVDVVKRKDAGQVVVGQLRAGDVFGEMSCLRKAPASASVVVRRGGTLLKLPRKDFDELVVSYPPILELVAELSEERAEHLDAILTGHAQWTEEGLVLI